MSQQILNDFKDSLIEFLDELIVQFPNEGDLIISRIFLKDQIPICDVMNLFIEKLLPHKEAIKNRNEAFFLENDVLFQGFRLEKVNYFKKLWMSDNLHEDDKETIFQWFEVFIKFSEKYKQQN